MYRKFLCCLFLLCLVSAARADDATVPETAGQDTPRWSPAKQFWVFEGFSVVNSELATLDPKAFGGFLMVLPPLMVSGSKQRLTADDWTAATGFEALGVYDFTAYGHDYSRRKVFTDNMVGFTLLNVTRALMERTAGDVAADAVAQHLSIDALPRGGFQVAYHWTL